MPPPNLPSYRRIRAVTATADASPQMSDVRRAFEPRSHQAAVRCWGPPINRPASSPPRDGRHLERGCRAVHDRVRPSVAHRIVLEPLVAPAHLAGVPVIHRAERRLAERLLRAATGDRPLGTPRLPRRSRRWQQRPRGGTPAALSCVQSSATVGDASRPIAFGVVRSFSSSAAPGSRRKVARDGSRAKLAAVHAARLLVALSRGPSDPFRDLDPTPRNQPRALAKLAPDRNAPR